MSFSNNYLEWRRGPAVGCVFARLVAVSPATYDQKIEVVPTGGTPRRIAGNIAKRIDRLIEDSAVSAAVLLMPGLLTLEDLCRVSLVLDERPMWAVRTTTLQNPPAGETIAVHIVREIPFGTGSCPSEALVLGPFPEFPPTRRAPVTAMEIYVGKPRAQDPKTGAPTTKANLAHLGLHLPTQKAFDTMWMNSIAGRLQSLGGEDSRAKAKISFVIPIHLANRLGCAP